MAILVTRGECSFAAKAEQAAKAGASALFIINSDNTIPVVGGRPSVAIPFPVVMVPSSAGRRLRKATKRAGALATVTVFLPPSLALHSLTVTMQPRKCTGAERLAVVAVRSDTTTTGVQALLQTAQLQDVATTVVPDVPTALDYLKRATLPPDVIVFIGTNAASSSHGAAVLAAADRIATAFCAIAKPLVFGKAPGPVSPSAAFPASADLSTFVAFSDVAQAVLTAQQGGVDVGVQLANWTNTTGVDTHAAVFADGTGSSVCELQTAAMEAAVAADGTTTDDLLTTAPIALGPSGSACTRGEGGGGHPSASVPKPGLWRQPRFLSSAPAVLSASDSSTMWEHTWAGNDDHFKVRLCAMVSCQEGPVLVLLVLTGDVRLSSPPTSLSAPVGGCRLLSRPCPRRFCVCPAHGCRHQQHRPRVRATRLPALRLRTPERTRAVGADGRRRVCAARRVRGVKVVEVGP